jgi:hypothetical protein
VPHREVAEKELAGIVRHCHRSCTSFLCAQTMRRLKASISCVTESRNDVSSRTYSRPNVSPRFSPPNGSECGRLECPKDAPHQGEHF